MSEIEIERLVSSSSHVNRAARWLNEEWGQALGFTLGQTLEWCLDVTASDSEGLFGATLQDRLIGVALLVRNDLESEPRLTPWLSGLYVAPDHRGHDVGAILAGVVEDAARHSGHDHLYLFCPKGPLQKYYTSMNWTVQKHTTVDENPAIVMHKKLAKS